MAELAPRIGRQGETWDLLKSMVLVDRKGNMKGVIRDASVKMPIKMTVKDDKEEADVLNMV